jgi:hypothetical protein
MPKTQLSVPVALIVIVIGVAVTYYVLHANGWSLNGHVELSPLFQRLSIAARTVVVGGFVATAWGTGALINALVAKRSASSPTDSH